MAAWGVALLLWWWSGRGAAVWRYYSNSLNYQIFTTRSTIIVEYEGTLFSEWKVSASCFLKSKSSAKTELRCTSPGVHTVQPIVTGPEEEDERYLSVDKSNTCFLWYYRVENFLHNFTQLIVTWIYDPENADWNEVKRRADTPSLNSKILSNQLSSMGQKPIINTVLKRRTYFPQGPIMNGTWKFIVPMTTDDIVKNIKGNQVVFQDCFIADVVFLLTFPLLTIPEIPGYLSISSPKGSSLISDWNSCVPSSAVLVNEMETFQTNDSFSTWTRIRVPPNILTDDERHSVTAVTLTWDGVYFLIKGTLYLKDFFRFKRLGTSENLPNNGIIGVISRKWCWSKYIFKSKGRRSTFAVWTENEIYLNYASLVFVKLTTTNELKTILDLSPTATLAIHNLEYLTHPLEFVLILSYCIICTSNKKLYFVIYNEDSEQWLSQDFTLDVPSHSFLASRSLYSAIPEFILWDKHRVYYSYHNFTVSGVFQTPTENGNLSRLSQNSTIHDVFIDYFGNIVIKMENNVMFYSKINVIHAVKLHPWINNTTKSVIALNTAGSIYIIYSYDNGTIQTEEYPLKLEAQSMFFKIKDECPYMAFYNNIFSVFYFLDKGENLSLWSQIVYPENLGLYMIMESYGPKILKEEKDVHYETALGYCTKTMTVTLSQTINYEAVDDYFKLQDENTGLALFHIRPSEYSPSCPMAKKVFQIAVGCDSLKYIAVKGFDKTSCRPHNFSYVIEKSYLRHQPSEDLKVNYDWETYGCPLRLRMGQKFHPVIQLFHDNEYIEDIAVNFIVWEIHGRNDYSFNATMRKSGCLNEAQSWNSMIELNKDLPLEDVWGPHNYKNCFSYAIGKPGDLDQPYEIINKSNYNHITWHMDHFGMYVFRVKVLDPNYSFCNLTAIFSVEIFGLIPRPNAYLVASFLFLLMLMFFSILVLSYFRYMKIYRLCMYEPLYRLDRKQKKY
ncbi:cation channel sperm-associated auxiliary subunit epsilon [Dasypus novemcinctus]|uniref:cation channel sperm-associated auxiliary subunit epsilon n=1 Tax=Dasypus novemcinctus TaxID=9361 RepID=UPI00265E14BC|nr:cation channel sperm-associated auxiliary subunit epsilon [Dasypus novemcinctus]